MPENDYPADEARREPSRAGRPTESPAAESGLAEISRGIVGVHADHYGRGPTKAKTVWRDDVVICVLENIFTRSEAVLVESGRFDQVRTNRQAFQDTVAPLLRQVVETTTATPVRSFLSQVSAEGIASEVFILDRPQGPR